MEENGDFTITRLSPADTDIVSTLVASVIQPLTYYNARARNEEIAKYSSVNLQAMIAEDPDSVLIAVVNNEPAGFCISKYDDGLIWLSWFGTTERFKRKGIGKNLLRALENTVGTRRAHKIWCDTRTDNLASQSVLKEAGFTRVGHFTNHWYGHDYFIWEKYVEPAPA
jgi:RimJ/RimL family protein N-acetyltransferase